jgi:hypothetical protein
MIITVTNQSQSDKGHAAHLAAHLQLRRMEIG